MPVPKRRSSRSRLLMKRAQKEAQRYQPTQPGICSHCGSAKLPHRICGSCGYYDGKLIIEKTVATEKK